MQKKRLFHPASIFFSKPQRVWLVLFTIQILLDANTLPCQKINCYFKKGKNERKKKKSYNICLYVNN